MSQCSAAITWGEEDEEEWGGREACGKPPRQEWAVKANVSDGDVLFVSAPLCSPYRLSGANSHFTPFPHF